MQAETLFQPGERITHHEFGQGVVLDPAHDGYLRTFFGVGERLGQLSERLNYDRLYQEALSDPELKRTKVELEAALSNSREARQVVFNLFQEIEGFNLDDYKPFSDVSSSLDRLVRFLCAAVERQQTMSSRA